MTMPGMPALALGTSLALASFGLAAGPAPAQSSNIFASLLGTWSGVATVKYLDASQTLKTDRIHCSAYYNGGGAQLSMVVICKGDTNAIEMRSRLSNAGGQLTGHWEERTYNAEGDVRGAVNQNHMGLTITGAVSGTMSVDVAAGRHTVSISVKQSSLQSVVVTLQRS